MWLFFCRVMPLVLIYREILSFILSREICFSLHRALVTLSLCRNSNLVKSLISMTKSKNLNDHLYRMEEQVHHLWVLFQNLNLLFPIWYRNVLVPLALLSLHIYYSFRSYDVLRVVSSLVWLVSLVIFSSTSYVTINHQPCVFTVSLPLLPMIHCTFSRDQSCQKVLRGTFRIPS